MPDESVVNYDLLTPEALARIEERALKHKILTVAEPAKASSRLRRTLVRLHTQRQLTAYASERDPDTGERTTQPHPVRGPTALFLLTPDIDPDDELARHSLVPRRGSRGRPGTARPPPGRGTADRSRAAAASPRQGPASDPPQRTAASRAAHGAPPRRRLRTRLPRPPEPQGLPARPVLEVGVG